MAALLHALYVALTNVPKPRQTIGRCSPCETIAATLTPPRCRSLGLSAALPSNWQQSRGSRHGSITIKEWALLLQVETEFEARNSNAPAAVRLMMAARAADSRRSSAKRVWHLGALVARQSNAF